MTLRTRLRLARAGALALGIGPAVGLAVVAASDGLGANPIEFITHWTGRWALRLLLLCLAVTPVRRIAGLSFLARERRTLGLFAFGWACLHLLTWSVVDMELDAAAMLEDVFERPFVTAGLATFSMLLPLALTSTRAAQRRLGRGWKRLHRLSYAAAVGAVVHFLWVVKADEAEPLVYGAIVAALLGARLWLALRATPKSTTSEKATAIAE